MSNMKKLLPFVVIIFLVFLIKNNITAIFRTLEDKNTAGTLKEKLAEEEKKNKFLKERLFYVKTDKFIEKEAREKLSMSRPGEYIVIGPTSTPLNREKIETDTKPNWQKWLDLFL